MATRKKILVGTCGFPKSHALCYRDLDAVEVQQTFYEPPRPETLARWRAEAPDEFEFTMKAYQAITHPPESPTYRRSRLSPGERQQAGLFRDTEVVREAWARTLACARALGATVVVFQCPARFRATEENITNMRRFFKNAERDGLTFGWEPRGESWTATLIRELCRDLNLVHVVDPFVATPVHRGLNYFRLHGKTGYRYRYTDEDLDELLARCVARTTYCMFNNVAMWDDALRFRKRVRGG